MRLVRITWLDSAAAQNRPWLAADETVRSVKVSSVGFLVHQDKRDTIIAQSFHGGGQLGNVLAIPSRSIVRLRTVRT